MERDNRICYRLSLTALLLVFCLVLATGSAFGRFRTKLDPFEYWFEPKSSTGVILRGLDADGNLTDLPDSWIIEPDGSSLAFGVSNEAAEIDLSIAIQIVVGEDISNGDSLNFILTPDGEEEGYSTKMVRIQKGTQLYEEIGAGWIYRFVDADGKEMTWTLDGGTLSVFRGELFCTGRVTVDNSGLLQLQVIAAF